MLHIRKQNLLLKASTSNDRLPRWSRGGEFSPGVLRRAEPRQRPLRTPPRSRGDPLKTMLLHRPSCTESRIHRLRLSFSTITYWGFCPTFFRPKFHRRRRPGCPENRSTGRTGPCLLSLPRRPPHPTGLLMA